MSAYVIVNIDVRDTVAYEEYKAKVPALIQRHGGEYLAGGGRIAVLEGQWHPDRLVILRFPDISSAQHLYEDPDYAPLKPLRQRVSTGTNIVIVEGVQRSPSSDRARP